MRRSSRCSRKGSISSIEARLPRRRTAAVVAAALLVASSGAVYAHSPAPQVTRELLRLQGHKREGAECTGRSLQLSALGKSAAFCADEYRRLAVATEQPVEIEQQPVAIDLQGSRSLLARFGKARSDQKITILGEWRPGHRDLFLIALDLCPEE